MRKTFVNERVALNQSNPHPEKESGRNSGKDSTLDPAPSTKKFADTGTAKHSVSELDADRETAKDRHVTQTQQDEEMITQFADPATEPKASDVQPTADRNVSERDGAFPQLTDQLEKDLVQVFKLLADETRLKILFFLGREKELHVSALCERLGQSQPAVSHHLALLRVAGLIEPRRDGKHNFYSIQQNRFHVIMGELFRSFTEAGSSNEFRFEDFTFRQERQEG